MAERIGNVSPMPGPPQIYPWQEWTDGSGWRIRRGEDFKSTAASMRSVITAYASRNGLRVQTSVPDPETVEFQFSDLKEVA